MIDNEIFVATYWPNVRQSDRFETDSMMAKPLIPLPIDQRYGEKEMGIVLEIINKWKGIYGER